MCSEKNDNIENDFVSLDTVFNNVDSTEQNFCESGHFERGDSLIENQPLRQSAYKRSVSLNDNYTYEYPRDDFATRSHCSELDICVTDIASFLSNQEERKCKLTKWSTRRKNLNKSPDFDNDFDHFGELSDYEDVHFSEGFVTPPNLAFPAYNRWTPDVYESVTRSLKEFRKTYQESESSSIEESPHRQMTPFVSADEYTVRLPNMDIEDKAMYIDRLIVKSFRHLNNLTKVRFREMLDDDVITTVMERYKDQYRDILFVTPCITKCVMVLQDQVANFLDPIKAKDYDSIFFVISDATAESNSGMHWSLLLLNRRKKTFYHYDSMHGSHYNAAFELMYKIWSYFKIKRGFQPDCEQQPNGTDCGFYVIHNMLRCIRIIKEELYDDDGERITLREPLKLPISVDETKSVVIKTYVANIADKVKKTMAENF